jgi:hypothetical protein
METNTFAAQEGPSMNAPAHEPFNLSSREVAVLAELLEAERTRVLVEIRHTDHRAYRDELRERINTLEDLIQRFRPT